MSDIVTKLQLMAGGHSLYITAEKYRALADLVEAARALDEGWDDSEGFRRSMGDIHAALARLDGAS